MWVVRCSFELCFRAWGVLQSEASEYRKTWWLVPRDQAVSLRRLWINLSLLQNVKPREMPDREYFGEVNWHVKKLKAFLNRFVSFLIRTYFCKWLVAVVRCWAGLVLRYLRSKPDVCILYRWDDGKRARAMPHCFTFFVIPHLPKPESTVVERLDSAAMGI